ncbi:MAG: DUF1573 domain-containing protein [Planctomycetota bacterium]|nr:DUF1573 domain-containing protein [Planctomycetota bacterium]
MKRNKLAFKFTLLSIILLLAIGCRQQAAKVQNIEQTAEPLTKAAKTVEFKETAPKQAPKSDSLLPRISFEKTVCDLGEVGQDSKNTCGFKFTNTGQGLLKIGNIKRTCGCTVFELDKKEYEPGQSASYSGNHCAELDCCTLQPTTSIPPHNRQLLLCS